MILSWLVPVVYSLLPRFWDKDPSRKIHKAYIAGLQLFGVVVPFVFITFAYIRMIRQVRRRLAMKRELVNCPQVHGNEIRRLSSDVKAAKVFGIISSMFLLCWLPIIYMTTVTELLNRPDLDPNILATVSLFTIALSSLVNPVLHAFFKTVIQKYLLRRPLSQNREVLEMATVARITSRTNEGMCIDITEHPDIKATVNMA